MQLTCKDGDSMSGEDVKEDEHVRKIRKNLMNF